jgi:hypothetical protein
MSNIFTGAGQVPGLVTFPSDVGPPLTAAAISISASGTIVSGVAGKSIRVYAMVLTVLTATTVQIQDESNNLTGAMQLAAGVPLFFDFTSMPWFVCNIGDDLKLALGSGVATAGSVWYTQV